MIKPNNIFGLTREEKIVAGLPLFSKQSFTPQERVWFQENGEKLRNEFNEQLMEFVSKVKDRLKYKTQEEAYHAVQEYRRGSLETELYDKIDFIHLEDPLKRDTDVDELELTYFLNSRIIKDKFPKDEFRDVFGLEYDGTWTIEHTKAVIEIQSELTEFFSSEASGKKKPEESATTGK